MVSAIVVSGGLVCMAFIDIQPLPQDGLENGESVQSEASDSLLPRLWAFILIGGNNSVAIGFERMYSYTESLPLTAILQFILSSVIGQRP